MSASKADIEALATKMKARAEELNRVASDPNVPQLDRIEAQNKLLGISMTQIAASSGMGGGLREVLKEATAKVEPYAEMFRHLETVSDTLDERSEHTLLRLDRVERNLKVLMEREGLTYQL